MKFDELREFIVNKMKMNHIYQPLLILTLLDSGDVATLRQLAIEFVGRDEAQIDDYKKRIVSFPIRDLKNHEVIDRTGELVQLKLSNITLRQRAELKMLCESKIQEFIINRDLNTWDNKLMDNSELDDNLRERIILESNGRCSMCGKIEEEDRLEIDHIIPILRGGRTSYENLQVLCKKCNTAKVDCQSTDYRSLVSDIDNDCLFCIIKKDNILFEDNLAYVVEDKNPVTPGHSLIIPKRHFDNYFEISKDENNSVLDLLKIRKKQLTEEDSTISGFNVGINSGRVAGQTISHCHIHLIPRRTGDVDDATGGVRGVIPGRQKY